MRYTVLTDDDVRCVLPMRAVVDRIESALREHAEGTLVAPPRFQVNVEAFAREMRETLDLHVAPVVSAQEAVADDMTLFCTAGLSGPEVAVASEALRRASHMEGL